jgi:methylglyoxal synthase
MAYTTTNFKSKKALKEAVAQGMEVTVFQPGPFGGDVQDGTVFLEGPHYPQPHRWYAKAEVRKGVVVKVA